MPENGPRLLLAAILLTTACLCASAQEPYLNFGRIDGSQSLTNIPILDIAQDPHGFMWFATRGHGLVRYDGYEFRVFRPEPGNSRSLGHAEVTDINFDAGGTMWVSTATGIYVYDPTTESFEYADVMPEDPDHQTRFTSGSVIDKHGTLWVAKGRDLYRKDKGSDTVRIYPVEPTTPSAWMSFFVKRLLLDSKGTLFVGTSGGGLLRYEPDTDSFSRFMHDPDDTDSIAGDFIHYIYEDSAGFLWISTDKGLSKKEKDSDTFNSYFVGTGKLENDVSTGGGPILEDSYGNFWVALENQGVFLLDRESGSHIQYSHDPADPGSLASNTVSSMFEDRSGVIWFGSDAVNTLVPSIHAFTQIDNPMAYVGTRRRTPNAMIQSGDGAIWLDGMEGADRYDPISGTWQRFSLFPGEPTNPQNEVTTIHEDETGTIWLGHPNYLSRIDPNTGVQSSIRLPSRPVDIHVDRSGRLWLSLPYDAGLFEADFESGTVRQVSSQRWPIAGSISHGFTSFVLEDRSGRFWVGAYNGLNQFQPIPEEFKNFFSDDADLSSISDKEILSISEMSDGSVWIGTGNGLNRFEPATNSFERFHNGESAYLNRINGIAQSASNRLWITTGGGLAEFDPTTGMFRNFDTADGMPELVGQSIVHSTHDDLIYMATTSGLVTMDPAKIAPQSIGPAIVLTDFRLSNRPVMPDASNDESPLKSSITTTRQMTLRPEHSIISFGFSALDYANPAENQYMYMLEGFEQGWVRTESNRRIASYTNLPAGNYVFRVKAADSAGVWNEEGISLNLSVLPPWWQTQWAYLAYVVMMLSMITGFIQFRTRALNLRKAELEDEVRDRTAELSHQKHTIEDQATRLQDLIEAKNRYITNISHEFRTPLTVILGPIERLHSGDPDSRVDRYLDAVQRNASRLLRLVDKLLGLSQVEMIKPESAVPQPVPPVVRHVVASIEALANEKEIVVETGRVQDIWVMCTTGALEEIVVNLVSNALKYTQFGGAISIEAKASDAGMVCISVIDNGPGIAQSDQKNVFDRFYRGADLDESIPGSGLGLALVHELVTVNGGQISLESELGQGTRVEIFLPAAESAPELQEISPESTVAINEAHALNQQALNLEQKSSDAVPQIVVIEDNLDLCEHVGEILASNFHCMFAHDGQSGLEMVTAEIPDLVLCDVMLPKINGFEVTRQIKHDDRTCHIPVVLLTARADEDSRIRGLKELADAYITKPFSEKELVQRIESILSIREILRQRFSKDFQLASDYAVENSFTGKDKRFVKQMENVLELNFSNAEFSTSELANLVNMSERQLQRKLKALINYTPSEYLRDYRLRQAMVMLADGISVSVTSFRVGFQSHSYFGKCFKARFGMRPSDVASSKTAAQAKA